MNKITRTIALSAAALVTVGGLTACSTGTTSDATTSSATPSAAAPLAREGSTPSTNEDLLVAAYESEFGNIDASTEGMLVDLGYTVCESFDSGMTFFEIGQIGVDEGIPAYETGFIIGASVAAFCPEYNDDVTNAAQDAGVTA